MGVVNTTYTFTSTDTITSAKMNNIIDDTTFTSDAIQGTTLQVVSPGKLAVSASGITSNELASDSVTTAKIADSNVTQAKLASNVVGNGPAFRAWASTMTSIPAVTQTKINLESETFDTNSNFASSRFTPTIAGYYLITGTIFTDSSVMIGFLASIFKNGVTYANGSSQVRANALRATVNDIVYLNGSTDYVELYSYHESSGSFNIVAGETQTYFSGCLIRSA
jgi:hypothetical protein